MATAKHNDMRQAGREHARPVICIHFSGSQVEASNARGLELSSTEACGCLPEEIPEEISGASENMFIATTNNITTTNPTTTTTNNNNNKTATNNNSKRLPLRLGSPTDLICVQTLD